MDQRLVNVNIIALYKQRNVMLVLCAFLLLSNILLSVFVLTMDKRIILVPFLKNQMEVSSSSVSVSYLQAMTDMFLSNLLDLNESNVEIKKDSILKNTASNSFRDISNYFDKQIHDIKKFKISTYFTPRTWKINEKKLEVLVVGILTSRFGESGSEEKEIEVRMSFVNTGDMLRLANFLPMNVEVKK